MDTNEDDLNADFKKENIEITASPKLGADDTDDDAVGEIDPALAEKVEVAENFSDDELDADKMDFEPDEKNYL